MRALRFDKSENKDFIQEKVFKKHNKKIIKDGEDGYEKEMADFNEDGDYVPNLYKAKTIMNLAETQGVGDKEEFNGKIELDFDPFSKEQELFKKGSLKQIEADLEHRMFESDQKRSQVMDMAALYVRRTNHSTHQKISEIKEWKEVYDSLEDDFEDTEFPADDT